MKKAILYGLLLSFFCIFNATEANDKMSALNTKEQKIVNIGMYTAHGDMPNLKTALAEGLDAGLTVNEIKEVLTQLYAYCGFPRSLNALGNFMALVKEREAKGIRDVQGKLPGPLPAGKSIDFGTARRNSAAHRSGERSLSLPRQSTNTSRRTCSVIFSDATISTGEPAKSPRLPRLPQWREPKAS